MQDNTFFAIRSLIIFKLKPTKNDTQKTKYSKSNFDLCLRKYKDLLFVGVSEVKPPDEILCRIEIVIVVAITHPPFKFILSGINTSNI